MKKRIKICLIIISIIASITLIVVYMQNKYLFVKSDIQTKQVIGVIDGKLSNYNDIITKSNIKDYTNDEITHGDQILNFVKEICNAKVAYYDASDVLGKVETEQIILGLEWMKKNHIKYVNISLSSNKYDKDLDDWISENKNDVIVFASYNNIANSFDYPAMYEDVIGSGIDSNIVKKDNDVLYSSNNIIINYNFNKNYQGNSYLSMISLLDFIEMSK